MKNACKGWHLQQMQQTGPTLLELKRASKQEEEPVLSNAVLFVVLLVYAEAYPGGTTQSLEEPSGCRKRE